MQSQVQREHEVLSFKRQYLFYLTRVTFELKAIKQEKTKPFFLKFLAKKIWESLSNNQLCGSIWVSVACEANDKSPFMANLLDLDHKNSFFKNNDDQNSSSCGDS